MPERVIKDDVIHAVNIISECMQKDYGKIIYKREQEGITVYVEREDYDGRRRVDVLNDEDEISEKSSEVGIRLAVS